MNRYDLNVSTTNLSHLLSIQQRLIAIWFSLGTIVGLICFVLTPIYLTWLLLNELNNAYDYFNINYLTTIITTTILPTIITKKTTNDIFNSEIEEESFKAAISSLSETDKSTVGLSPSLFYVPLQEHVQSNLYLLFI